ncbi:MAG: hypothetical protein A3C22_00400 [Candidatus Levybacteria bacterium RIFCSPHIGHO2_02_FULL_37_10]|nr:MAG: hypothetical protein A3C22_00400 [Candidatus Levybacteria bacterium RIFCSPHIGHO2_02_FULL_37_10]
MKDSLKGRRLHALAEDAREGGDFLKALEYVDRATFAYQKDSDIVGLSEVQSSRQSIFKHLYRKTGDLAFLILEKHSAIAAVEIAEQSGIKEALAIPYHNLGKYYFEAKEYINASKYFKKAIENLETYPNNRHSRSSVIADIRGHQYAAEYHAGDKTALNRALDALKELKNSQEDSTYNKNAWVSGAHIRIFQMIARDNLALARKHFGEATTIIGLDKRQILRKRQLEKLNQPIY